MHEVAIILMFHLPIDPSQQNANGLDDPPYNAFCPGLSCTQTLCNIVYTDSIRIINQNTIHFKRVEEQQNVETKIFIYLSTA